MRSALSEAKWLPREFVHTSSVGGLFSIVAFIVMGIVLVLEFKSFMSTTTTAYLTLDRRDGDLLQVNFNVDLYDIECRNLKVLVRDSFGEEPLKMVSKDFVLTPILADGKRAAEPFRRDGEAQPAEEDDEEAAHSKKQKELEKKDGKKELDADWANSHDGFKHKSFDHVVQFHDFTFINFFAEWCGHCRDFSPTWKGIAARVNGDAGEPQKFKDADGKMREVRMLKMNCVDYQELCTEKGIDAYPMLRLYKSDGTFSLFDGHRNEAGIIAWLESTVASKSYGHFVEHHEAAERGCNADGRFVIPRVPSQFELLAGNGDQNLNPSLTNVSHMVRHLSFSDPGDGRFHRQAWGGLTFQQLDHISPLDGKKFITNKFHEAYQHYIKIVSTVTKQGLTAYQFSSQLRLAQLGEEEIAQSMFHFDIEPFSVWMKSDSKRWYDFGTATLAILGGVHVVMRLLAMGSRSVVGTVKQTFAGTPRSRSGLLDSSGMD